MLDNQLIRVFAPIITAGLTANGYTGVGLLQFDQPTQQGVPSGPTVYFQKIMDHPRGWVERQDLPTGPRGYMHHVETQIWETTFQVNALVIQNPAVISYTAADLVNAVLGIMQSSSTLQTLQQNDIQIYKPDGTRNPYFLDDKDRFEASPSFDFTLVHKMITTTLVPVVSSVNPGVYPV